MRIQDLNHKKVALLGYAREGQAMHLALQKFAPTAEVTVCDAATHVTPLAPAATQTGPHYLHSLEKFDVIIKSAGIKDLPELAPHAARITGQTDIFFDTVIDSGITIIGVTGSKGKSTTTTLIYEALKAHYGNRVSIMGNIGIPAIEFILQAKPGAFFVNELSSFQLEHLKRSPHVAIITSFFPEHLDRHGSVASYWQAKRPIAQYQTPKDAVFYNATYPECKELAEASPGKRIPFTATDFPLEVSHTKFKGEHNRGNLAAAYLVAQHLGVPAKTALQALCATDPLPHRLQPLGKHAGIYWVNDSFATAPDATIAGLHALGDDVQTLITGGLDRGVDYSKMGAALAKLPVKNIVLFPDTGQKIKQAIESACPQAPKTYHETSDMTDAVKWAAANTTPGKICLLSSASPSFNLFKDFVVRGEAFVAAIKKLKE